MSLPDRLLRLYRPQDPPGQAGDQQGHLWVLSINLEGQKELWAVDQ